ncbi:4-phosphoerythronate dehydrogenase PdxB [Bacteroides sp. 51]|uniref:4-phosphoerythronate dehydrogenase PdxB n=1 Tax=Bacteroides sp. 51 TaxID=2302938 RepID=UPI0013D6EB9F|nr:4-phosphoerythronate dehydrogenase PdxB [Bacteroides sp. 51]NDV80498.1 4-phosphoerythronate dehydrogenase PdxB [Bacteroides sp. 51]
MKVVVDEKIPYIQEAIKEIADEVVYAPGNGFTPELIRDADALIIRTRTKCNRKLLEGSKVQFIATATIGYDHIDVQYCHDAGISWINAPGSNANSVAEYIESCLALLLKEHNLPLGQMKMGIIGVGNVGTLVAKKTTTFGMTVLQNDPPRASREGNAGFSTLGQIAEQCDIISFHTPLNMEGQYKTYHLGNEAFFRSLKKKPIIINTSRGEVVDTEALLRAMDEGLVSTNAIIDVWENEPDINRELLKRAYITTPHIAGYSADGKGNATRMALEGLCRHFHIDARINIKLPRPRVTAKNIFNNPDDIILLAYNPQKDTNLLKEDPESFEDFRNNYPVRREVAMYYEAWDKYVERESKRKLNVLHRKN